MSGDSKGYERGAKGIDGKKGEDFVSQGQDNNAVEGMYGRNWGHNAGTKKGGTQDITRKGPQGSW